VGFGGAVHQRPDRLLDRPIDVDEPAVGFEFEEEVDHEAEVGVFAADDGASVGGFSLAGFDPVLESIACCFDWDRSFG